MKICTYNVNGVNGRLPALLRWLKEAEPDCVCLQELKAPDEKFPLVELQNAGYEAVWHGQKQWNGVAILARGARPQETRRGLPVDPAAGRRGARSSWVQNSLFARALDTDVTGGRASDSGDAQSRYIEAAVNGIIVGCLYLPNGNPAPGPKFDYKLAWFERLKNHAKSLLALDIPVVLAGDFNVIPTELDAKKPENWRRDALFFPESRAAYQELLDQGWTDSIRKLHPRQSIYTFWDYFRNSYERDSGIRIDHLLLSPNLVNRLKAAGVYRHVRGWEKSSDHAPTWIELSDTR